MRFRFDLAKASLTDEEIRSMVAPEVLDYIKSSKEKPLLKAYIVAHEGEVSPNFEEGYTGNRVLKFTRKAIKSVFESIKTGVSFFYDHYKVSPDEPRKSVAKVVGKSLREIGDKLTTVIVAFFEDEEMAKYNSISMEADLQLEESGNVSDVLSFTGVALVPFGEQPAFPNANSLGSIRAINNNSKGTKMSKFIENSGGLDWHAIEAEFRRLKGLPSQVTDPEEMIGQIELTADGRLIATGKDKKYSQYVVGLVQSAIEKSKKDTNPDIDNIKKERDELARKVAQYEVRPKILDKAKSMKLGDQFVQYIEKRVDRFKPIGENLESSIDEWLEDKKLDYSDAAELRKATQPDTSDQTLPDPTDYSDPRNNPLL